MEVGRQPRQAARAVVACWDGASEQSLAQALIPPAIDCVEAGLMSAGSGAGQRAAAGGGLRLTITARSAYRHAIAKVFAGALQTRLNLSADLQQRVRTALQEAMSNALLHGNLGLGPGFRDDLSALAALPDLIEARFASEPVALSTIGVGARWTRTILHVVVCDSGLGFTRPAPLSPEERLAADDRGCGRGLVILEELCDRVRHLRGGTAVVLGFLLPSGET